MGTSRAANPFHDICKLALSCGVRTRTYRILSLIVERTLDAYVPPQGTCVILSLHIDVQRQSLLIHSAVK